MRTVRIRVGLVWTVSSTATYHQQLLLPSPSPSGRSGPCQTQGLLRILDIELFLL